MPGYYWIKYYHEILDDPKMAVLPDRLWRRFSELCLFAGTLGTDGVLPNTQKIAWRLRMQTDDLSLDMTQLASIGFIQQLPDGWLVKNFAKRQAPAEPKERKAAQREREQKKQYYSYDDNVTDSSRNVTQINRLTEEINRGDTEEIRENKERIISFSILDAEKAICQVAPFPVIPSGWMEQADKILSLLQQFGWDETISRLMTARTDWVKQKRKDNGKQYSVLNPTWINNAIAGETIGKKELSKFERDQKELAEIAERNKYQR